MHYSRRSTFVAAIVVSIMPAAAMAEKLSLAALSDYLNGLRTAEAEFTQVGDDGSLATGTLFIKRPGRLRFEYNPPQEALVVAGGSTVVVFDPKSDQVAESFPLGRTPLSIILAPRVDLARARMVVAHRYDGTATIVRAQDPENPDYGNIELSFTADPVTLRKWVVNDSGGGQTTVVLGDMRVGGQLPDSLFNTSMVGERETR